MVKNQNNLMGEYKTVAGMMLNGGFVWKPNFDQVDTIQKTMDSKFYMNYNTWSNQKYQM